jgi:hypothetical protein
MNNNIYNFNSKVKTIMNKSLNLNTMKNNYFKNTLKLGMTAIFIMALGTANAQTTDATNTNINKGAGSIETVKLIDNKGTIKYLQSNNGITSITSTNTGSATTTTFQLGGTLVDATTITTTDDESFTIDGVGFNLKETTLLDTSTPAGNAATTATSAAADNTATGYTLLVRDEATGRIKKMLATELVTSAYALETVNAAFITARTITIAGIGNLPTEAQKISVYRNGAKLRLTADYLITTNVISIIPSATSGWDLYDGDIIEVNVLKF